MSGAIANQGRFGTRANICSIYGRRKCVFVEASGELMQTRPIKGPPGDRSEVQWLMFWDGEKACGEPGVRRWA